MRRAPREPEEGGGNVRREVLPPPNLHRRVAIDPPQETSAPAAPTFSLNTRQLDLLKKRQAKDSDKPPFVTRSNVHANVRPVSTQRLNSTETMVGSEASVDKQNLRQILSDRLVASSEADKKAYQKPAVSSIPPVARGTPTRTPNPVSRFPPKPYSESTNSSSDPQRQFLRNMLQKAHSRESTRLEGEPNNNNNNSSHSGQPVDQKALLRRVLAKTRAKKAGSADNGDSTKRGVAKATRVSPKKQLSPKRKSRSKQEVSPPAGSRSAKLENNSGVLSLRDRLRRAKQGNSAPPAPVVVAPVASSAPPVESMPDLPAPRELSWRRKHSIEATPSQEQPQQKEPTLAREQAVPTDRPSTRLKTNPSSQRARAALVEEQEEEEEIPDGYDNFLQTLQTEVSGQHSQVRASNQKLVNE